MCEHDPKKTIDWNILASCIEHALRGDRRQIEPVYIRLSDGTMVLAKGFSIPEDVNKPAYLDLMEK